MSAEQAIRNALVASAPVNAVVAGHIYPVLLPQNPQGPPSLLPAIVYQRVSGDHPVAQDGASGPESVRVQLDLYGQTYDALTSLRGLVLAALNGFAGPWLQGVFSETESDLYDDEVKLFRVSMDFMAYEAAA